MVVGCVGTRLFPRCIVNMGSRVVEFEGGCSKSVGKKNKRKQNKGENENGYCSSRHSPSGDEFVNGNNIIGLKSDVGTAATGGALSGAIDISLGKRRMANCLC